MNYLKPLFIALLFVSCADKVDSSHITHTSNASFVQSSLDTIPSFSKKEKSLTPLWVKQLLLKIEQSEINTINQLSREIIQFEQLNDSLSYCIFDESSLNCSKQIIATLLNKRSIAQEIIAQNCDHDFSIPQLSWSEYEMIDKLKILKTIYSEYIPDSLLTDGTNIPKGKSFDDYSTTKDTSYFLYSISDNGEIHRSNPTH